MKVPLSSITRLETSRGKRRETLQGLAGGVVGGTLGSLFWKVDSTLCLEDDDYLCSRGEALAAGAIIGGLFGAALGALIKTERWGAVSLNTAPRMSGRQLRSAVALTVRF